MKNWRHAIAVVAMALMATGSASAGLIGDTVKVEVLNGSTVEAFDTLQVTNGVEFTNGNSTNIGGRFLYPTESIDLLDTSMSLVFAGALQRTFRVSLIDGVVTGATSSSGTVSNIVVDGDGHGFRFLYIAGSTVNSGTVNLTFAATNGGGGDVPEPATGTLLGAALSGLIWWKRRA